MSKPEKKKETKTIKGWITNEDGDLVMGLIEVPNTPEDKRPAFNPATDRMPKGMEQGTQATPKEGKSIVVTGVESL